MISYPGGIRSWWDHVQELVIVRFPAFSYVFFPEFSQVYLGENSTGGYWFPFFIIEN